MSVASLIRQGLGSTPSDLVRQGLESGTPPPAAIGPIITLGLRYTPGDVIRMGFGATGAGAAPTITSVTAVSGVALAVAWTGTATQYRLNGGAATALPDGTSPDTISGLTPYTTYAVELRDGTGAWSAAVTGYTDNTGEGGGELGASGGAGSAVSIASAGGGSAIYAATGGAGAAVSVSSAGSGTGNYEATGGAGASLTVSAAGAGSSSFLASGGAGAQIVIASAGDGSGMGFNASGGAGSQIRITSAGMSSGVRSTRPIGRVLSTARRPANLNARTR